MDYHRENPPNSYRSWDNYGNFNDPMNRLHRDHEEHPRSAKRKMGRPEGEQQQQRHHRDMDPHRAAICERLSAIARRHPEIENRRVEEFRHDRDVSMQDWNSSGGTKHFQITVSNNHRQSHSPEREVYYRTEEQTMNYEQTVDENRQAVFPFVVPLPDKSEESRRESSPVSLSALDQLIDSAKRALQERERRELQQLIIHTDSVSDLREVHSYQDVHHDPPSPQAHTPTPTMSDLEDLINSAKQALKTREQEELQLGPCDMDIESERAPTPPVKRQRRSPSPVSPQRVRVSNLLKALGLDPQCNSSQILLQSNAVALKKLEAELSRRVLERRMAEEEAAPTLALSNPVPAPASIPADPVYPNFAVTPQPAPMVLPDTSVPPPNYVPPIPVPLVPAPLLQLPVPPSILTPFPPSAPPASVKTSPPIKVENIKREDSISPSKKKEWDNWLRDRERYGLQLYVLENERRRLEKQKNRLKDTELYKKTGDRLRSYTILRRAYDDVSKEILTKKMKLTERTSQLKRSGCQVPDTKLSLERYFNAQEDKKILSRLKNCDFVDKGNHWCRFCNRTFDMIGMLLKHFVTEHWNSEDGRKERPWAGPKDAEKKLDLSREGNSGVKREQVALKGTEFFVPTLSLFCQLCKEFCGDTVCAFSHISSEKHNTNYMKYLELNPLYEKLLDAEKVAGSVICRNEERLRKQKEEVERQKRKEEERRRNEDERRKKENEERRRVEEKKKWEEEKRKELLSAIKDTKLRIQQIERRREREQEKKHASSHGPERRPSERDSARIVGSDRRRCDSRRDSNRDIRSASRRRRSPDKYSSKRTEAKKHESVYKEMDKPNVQDTQKDIVMEDSVKTEDTENTEEGAAEISSEKDAGIVEGEEVVEEVQEEVYGEGGMDEDEEYILQEEIIVEEEEGDDDAPLEDSSTQEGRTSAEMFESITSEEEDGEENDTQTRDEDFWIRVFGKELCDTIEQVNTAAKTTASETKVKDETGDKTETQVKTEQETDCFESEKEIQEGDDGLGDEFQENEDSAQNSSTDAANASTSSPGGNEETECGSEEQDSKSSEAMTPSERTEAFLASILLEAQRKTTD